MKARVKATGEIVEVTYTSNLGITTDKGFFLIEELEGVDYELDYWTRLEHQAAIAAMQGLVANQSIVYGQDFDDALDEHITVNAVAIAHALVQELKEEKK